MKKITSVLAAAALLFAVAVQAQTTTNYGGVTYTATTNAAKQVVLTPVAATAAATNAAAPTPQSFISTVTSYFSSFNTSLDTFGTNGQYAVWTGAAWQSGINLGAAVGFEAHPFAKAPGLMLGEVTTFAGVVGSIAQEEVDFGWSLTHYDVQASFGLCGADTFHVENGDAAGIKGGFFVEVAKAATENTFYGARLNEFAAFHGHGQQPPITLFAGFTF